VDASALMVAQRNLPGDVRPDRLLRHAIALLELPYGRRREPDQLDLERPG